MLSNNWWCFVASMHSSYFTNIKETSSRRATSPQSRGYLLMSSSGPCILRFVSLDLLSVFAVHLLWWIIFVLLFNMIRFVQMLYRWLMHLTILIISLVQFWDVMMEMCTRNCMRLRGRILSTNRIYPMASMNISGHYSSNNCRLLDCE